MSRRKSFYLITDQAPSELRREANDKGEVYLTASQAEYELLRGTIVKPPADKPKATPVRADGRA